MKPLLLSACCLFTVAATAATTVYRLELVSEELTGTETPYIVGADGERREVVLVEPEQYAFLTGRLDRVWREKNSTDSGRRELHGQRIRTEVDETNMVKTTVYADGYRHSQKFGVSKAAPKIVTLPETKTYDTAKRIEYLKKMREYRERTAKKKPRTVNVEHDASTGKDTVK